MGWYEVAKDALSMAQKLDNIELIKTILELQQQMSDMQEENRNLKNKLHEIEKADEIESKLIRHNNAPYYSLQYNGITENICAVCWNERHVKIPLNKHGVTHFRCPKCNSEGKFEISDHNE